MSTKKQPSKKKPSKKKSKLNTVKKQPVKKKVKPKRVRYARDQQGLTAKDKLFVGYYIGEAEFNGAKAARMAGFSEKTAKVIASELLTKPNVALAVLKAIDKREKEVETSAQWVLDRLHKQSVADLSDIYNELGGIKPMHEWPLVWRQGLVVGIETKQEFTYDEDGKVPDGYIIKVKISERIKRDELIGKHHAMFTDNVNLGGSMTLKNLTDAELDEKLADMENKK